MTDGQENRRSIGISGFGLAHAHNHTCTHSDFLLRDGVQNSKIPVIELKYSYRDSFYNPNARNDPFSEEISNNLTFPHPHTSGNV